VLRQPKNYVIASQCEHWRGNPQPWEPPPSAVHPSTLHHVIKTP
jgi:hypothetical protein